MNHPRDTAGHTVNDTADELARVLAHLHARVDALDAWRAHQSDLLDEHLNSHPDPDRDDLGPDEGIDGPDLVGDDFGGVDLGRAELDGNDADRRPAPPAIGGYALIEWVHDTVAAITARPLRGEFAWCPLWWEHPEAVFRFEALHGAWTELAPEPGAALSIWIRDHLDPCLQVLLSPNGPFADCAHTERHHRAPTTHRPLPTLPTTPP